MVVVPVVEEEEVVVVVMVSGMSIESQVLLVELCEESSEEGECGI